VLILAQRQAVLVAKQARVARRAVRRTVPARGRVEPGRVHRSQREFPQPRPPLGGARSKSCQALWGELHVTFAGKYHTIEDAGINPLPPRHGIRIWFGGHAEVTMQRVVKWGDGWMPLNYAPGDEAVAAFDKLRAMTEVAGRDPASIGIDTRTTGGIGAEAEWRETVRFWKSCGVTHLTLGTYHAAGTCGALMAGRWPTHLAAIKRYWNAVADLL
jgi:hypothetical protein